jgi:(3,5-dihydroxyphenyl)acetyl-CoA 1,2-dioxygenase
MPASQPNEKTASTAAGRLASAPLLSGDYDRDVKAFSIFWLQGLSYLDGLPGRAKRSETEQAEAAALLADGREARRRFLGAHVGRIYRDLTDGLRSFRRIEELADLAGEKIPGLCPTSPRLAREAALVQAEKDGHEIDQGLFFNYVLGDEACGRHLCHAMLLPKKEAFERLDQLKRHGKVDLPHASVERKGKASIVSLKNSRYLNAEDDTTLKDVETAVDLAMLDPETMICVLRGGVIEDGKYGGQRVFCTGINLTHLYYGRVPYLWYLVRDMGFVNKMYRGLAKPDVSPDEVYGETIEKPWIAAVEKFAIGGGCQYLLATDYNIAAKDAYMTLPARKEGIIPGAANMRLPRFVGDRITRQAIMSELRIECDSATGRMICDRIVEPEQIDQAIDEAVELLANSGAVNASSNRKAIRIVQEPLDVFRTYMAVYAREQAYCHFSPALVSNLERFWNAQQRKL